MVEEILKQGGPITTIACNRKEMAADSLGTVENSGFTYTTEKIFRIGKTLIGIAGFPSGAKRFLKWFEEGRDTDNVPEFDENVEYFVALVLEDEGIYRYESCCFPLRVLDDFAASGQGALGALTAMRLGKSPEEAVELMCELNGPTGPPVVVETL